MVVDGGGSVCCTLFGDLAANLINNGWHPLRSIQRSEGTTGEPAEFAGQIIQEGDCLYADDDGIVILNPA
ncbi:RraA family protein [Limnobaculum parvum]|uniref:4-hydroxy-4-methyl-2-oxoglutarate aldolase n=1 Tax=Limnobaculum parvum TaxID=2172103 RepID=A0A2Y9U171_9GAMM|nr:hypothetical protein [Limnobaculum parvum]AWH89717.1 hypothetical protein HYN51_14920 [Limnobaculum parvum]